MNDALPQYAELEIPRPGSPLVAVFGYAVLMLFTSFAIGNLAFFGRIPLVSAIASFAWLCLVWYCTVFVIRSDGGIRPFMINRLAVFSGRHYIRVAPVNHAKVLTIGFSFLDKHYERLVIDMSAVTSIGWSAGQASSMAGRDMADWSVALCFYDSSLKDAWREGKGVFVFEPHSSRTVTESLGMCVVEFLKTNGLQLKPGIHACDFETISPEALNEHCDDDSRREPALSKLAKRS